MRNRFVITVTVAFLIFAGASQAQILFKPDASVQQALQKVIADFPNRLQTITGSLLAQNIESTDYSSKVLLPGAENCVITQYKSKKNNSRSWQAVFPAAEDFGAAKKMYRNLFLQLKNMGVLLPGNTKPVKPSGNYDEPSEDKKFAGSIFRITETDTAYKNVKMEVALQYLISGWQVSVFVYNKLEDDEIAPDTEVNNQ